MKTETSIRVTSYPCPLCDKDVVENGFWVDVVSGDMIMVANYTPCCKVVVAFAITDDDIPIYVGSFRNHELYSQWLLSAGSTSGGFPAGSMWSVEKQQAEWDDEIPF